MLITCEWRPILSSSHEALYANNERLSIVANHRPGGNKRSHVETIDMGMKRPLKKHMTTKNNEHSPLMIGAAFDRDPLPGMCAGFTPVIRVEGLENQRMKRKSISKKTRFEVFKRDSFKCQYCGQSSPDVILVVDHIHPVAKGGDSDLLNLITSCDGCNSGKSDRQLSDQSAVSKQKDQLDKLNERRLQMEMMLEWRKSLSSLKAEELNQLASYWTEKTHYGLTDFGHGDFRKLLKKYRLEELLDAVDVACDSYLKRGPDGLVTSISVNIAFDKLAGICAVERMERSDPGIRDLFYIRGIIRKKCSSHWYYTDWRALALLKEARDAGASIESLRHFAMAYNRTSYARFEGELQAAVRQMRKEMTNAN
jgi:hypothetical protein